jgi:quercetin dioxygenase-like cupin family protein
MAELKILRVDDVAAVEVKAQMHGEKRVGTHLRFLEQTPKRVFIHCHYDPGMIIEEHGHASDHAIFILDGMVRIGEVDCGPRTLVVLEQGAVFGPLVAGLEGCELLEFYEGDTTPRPADPDGFEAMLARLEIVPVTPTFAPVGDPPPGP